MPWGGTQAVVRDDTAVSAHGCAFAAALSAGDATLPCRGARIVRAGAARRSRAASFMINRPAMMTAGSAIL